MPTPSLLQLATKACIKNINGELRSVRVSTSLGPSLIIVSNTAIMDVGEAPYDRVRAILSKIENPKQLVGDPS